MKMWVLFIRIGLLLLCALCFLSTCFLFLYSYDSFTSTIAGIARQQDKLEKFRDTLLTPARFNILKIISCAGTGFIIAAAIYTWKRIQYINSLRETVSIYVRRQVRWVKIFWQSLPAEQKYITGCLFALIVISRLYFVFRFPFHIDERFSYLYFVDKGLPVAMAYYPNPNNHILYSIICTIADAFFWNPLVVMKLPALIIGLLLSIVFWLVLIRYVTYPTALVATALFSFAEPVFYYSIHGRGYGLMLLFVLVSTHSALQIVNSPAKAAFAGYFWLWLSCTLGFYTIPVFLYPFTGLLLFLMIQLLIQKKYVAIKYVCYTSVAVILSVIILYLPVFIFNGPYAVWGNSWVTPQPWHTFLAVFPQHLVALAKGLWGILPAGLWITGIVIIFCLITVSNKKEPVHINYWVLLLLINILVIIAMCLLQRITLYRRVLTYLSLYQYVVMALMITKLAGTFKSYFVAKASTFLLPIWLFVAANVYEFYKITSSQEFGLYDSFDATANWLYQRDANHIFVNMYEYSLCIRFQYETSGKAIHMNTNQPVAGNEYTYLVIHPSRPAPDSEFMSFYRKVYQDTEAVIYKKK